MAGPRIRTPEQIAQDTAQAALRSGNNAPINSVEDLAKIVGAPAAKSMWKPALVGGTLTAGAGGAAVIALQDGTFLDTAGKLIETLNTVPGQAGARAGVNIGLEKIYAVIEGVGNFINNHYASRGIGNGDEGLGLVNYGRRGMGQEPMVHTSAGLVPESEVGGKVLTGNESVADLTSAFTTEQVSNGRDFTTADLTASFKDVHPQLNDALDTAPAAKQQLIMKFVDVAEDAAADGMTVTGIAGILGDITNEVEEAMLNGQSASEAVITGMNYTAPAAQRERLR